MLSGKLPYQPLNEVIVMSRIINGALPAMDMKLSTDLQRNLWNLCRQCWKTNPGDRPEMETIVSELIQSGLIRTAGEHSVAMGDSKTTYNAQYYATTICSVVDNLRHLDMSRSINTMSCECFDIGNFSVMSEGHFERNKINLKDNYCRLAIKKHINVSPDISVVYQILTL